MPFQFEPVGVYSNPVFFGPKPWEIDYEHMCYRLHQPADTTALTLVYETDYEKLEPLVPSCFKLVEPVVTIMASQFEHIGWLAGNSYNIYQVSIPCSYDGDRDHVVGDFLLCLFENHCDPIVGGREGLGYTKIFCNIPNFKKLNGVWTVPTSSWDFTFSKLTVDTNKKAKDEARFLEILNRSQGKMNFKYVPGTGKAEPDAAYPVFNPKWKKPDDYQFPMMETKIVNCDGNIEWFRPNWEDMPTYAHLAQYMASAPVKSIIGAQLKYYSDACDFSHSIQLK